MAGWFVRIRQADEWLTIHLATIHLLITRKLRAEKLKVYLMHKSGSHQVMIKTRYLRNDIFNCKGF